MTSCAIATYISDLLTGGGSLFSGIVEACEKARIVEVSDGVIRLRVARPAAFFDLKLGDSVAVNGICLTVEGLSSDEIVFAIGAETQKVTDWHPSDLLQRQLNLERSLALGDRIHGHLVLGHVDGMGAVESVEPIGECRNIIIAHPQSLRPYIWRKGSITVQGVSLTVNEVQGDSFSVCLIPETLRRTNLGDLMVGDRVTLEADSLARGMVHWLNLQGKSPWS